MGLLDPVIAIVVSFSLLGVLLYKRISLGITLNTTALLLGVLAVDLGQVPSKIFETSTDFLTISIVLASFGIMWLSQLYKETGAINVLSESLSKIVKSSKVILSLLPAVIGFLPVAGGALMSAPLVDSEAEKLKMKPEKKAYVNIWFRHTIFPVYPISPVLIITAALTGIAIPLIILRQLPVVIVMIIVGYFFSFWKIPKNRVENSSKNNRKSEFKRFAVAFSPILATILVVIALDLADLRIENSLFNFNILLKFDVVIATFIGLIILVVISKPNFRVFAMPLKRWGVYDVTLAAYGAFLLRKMIDAAGISGILKGFVADGSVDVLLFLTVIPAILGVLTGSPSGAVTIVCSILTGILAFSTQTASLLFMSAYLGYTIAPTHLCFTFTADYFKCPLGKIYKYVIPSFLASFTAALLVYFLV